MKQHITILPGDGIGHEVTQWGRRVLESIAAHFGHEFSFEEAGIGHAAIEATGTPLPDATLEACRRSDAVLLGAVGHPMYDNDPSATVRPEQGLLKIRKELGLYANIRPILIFDELLEASSLRPEILRGSDILFFRELTGGIYFGERGRHPNGDAYDTKYYSKMEVERIARRAFEAARTRRGRLHSVDKANVLESSRLWRETIQSMSADYPEVEVRHMFIDNAAMQLIRDPRQFDVVVTGNMFGDILTDEASQIAGSLGMLPSASVGDRVGIFEPVHGSAPDIAGQDKANPIATILSTALLLDLGLGLKAESQAVIDAVDLFLKEGYRTGEIARADTPSEKILGTRACGEQIVRLVAQVAPSQVS